jgi:arylamine N-acetyltransferase
MTTALPAPLLDEVLEFLEVRRGAAGPGLLEQLIDAYGRKVPWESASRIVKRQHTANTAGCPRWSEEFWRGAIQRGTGGTCFESNRAFLALLSALGFQGYLTINNMQETIGCHTAIVVTLPEGPHLVDAGYPIHTALPLDPHRATERSTPWYRYSAQPLGGGVYLVENTPHPRPYMFHLHDRPIDDQAYQLATTQDYGEHGLFLDRVIIRKIVADDVWRFNSAEHPLHLQQFHNGERIDHPLSGQASEQVAEQVGRHFGLDVDVLAEALAIGARLGA